MSASAYRIPGMTEVPKDELGYVVFCNLPNNEVRLLTTPNQVDILKNAVELGLSWHGTKEYLENLGIDTWGIIFDIPLVLEYQRRKGWIL